MRTFLLIDIPYQSPTQKTVTRLDVLSDREYYQVQTANKRTIVKLRNRRSYPGTYCYQAPEGDVVFGYGAEQSSIYDESLCIRLKPNGDLKIERDVICAMPLFYGYSNGHFVASNEYHEVVSRLE